jgi:hypothetical protein
LARFLDWAGKWREKLLHLSTPKSETKTLGYLILLQSPIHLAMESKDVPPSIHHISNQDPKVVVVVVVAVAVESSVIDLIFISPFHEITLILQNTFPCSSLEMLQRITQSQQTIRLTVAISSKKQYLHCHS